MTNKLLRSTRARLLKLMPSSITVKVRAHRHRARRRRADELSRQFESYGVDDLHDELLRLGMRRDGIVLVQSSIDGMINFVGDAEQLVSMLIEAVGPLGTLVMPAHPAYRGSPPHRFDVDRTPAQTGLLTEVFRRTPGVKRSLHPTHSVCATGPMAHQLLDEHHLDPLSCGPRSPYAQLADHDGQIVLIGLPALHTTFLHVVEDTDLSAFPRRIYVDEPPVPYVVVGPDQVERQLAVPRRDDHVLARIDLKRLLHAVNPSVYRSSNFRGTSLFIADAAPLLTDLRGLRDRGLVVYQ